MRQWDLDITINLLPEGPLIRLYQLVPNKIIAVSSILLLVISEADQVTKNRFYFSYFYFIYVQLKLLVNSLKTTFHGHMYWVFLAYI